MCYYHTYGVPVVITNSSNVIGPGQDSEKFLPRAIALIEAGDSVPIHVRYGREGSRVYNGVRNVADALWWILRPPTIQPERYHLPGGEEMTNLALAQMAARILGKRLWFHYVEVDAVRPGWDAHYAVLGGRLERYGWKLVTTVEETLVEMLT